MKYIQEEKVSSTTAGSQSAVYSTYLNMVSTNLFIGNNFDITIMATTGNTAIGLSTLLTATNGFLLTEGTIIDLQVKDALYLVGDSTTAKFQAIVWE